MENKFFTDLKEKISKADGKVLMHVVVVILDSVICQTMNFYVKLALGDLINLGINLAQSSQENVSLFRFLPFGNIVYLLSPVDE